MPPRKRYTKKASRSRVSNPSFLPFREGFGTSSTVDALGTSSTPVTSPPQTLVGSSVSLTQATSPIASLQSNSSMPDVVGCPTPVSLTQDTTSTTTKRKWTSEIWDEYHVYDGSVFEYGTPRAICKYCKAGPIDATSENGMALRMKEKFDKYWESYSLILSFAAMLHPRYKFQLIQRCFKELDLQTFESKSEHVGMQFRKLFDEYVKHTSAGAEGNIEVEDYGDDVEGLQDFDELSEHKSELDAYLEAPRAARNTRFSVLVWRKDNASKYPLVAQMARDILAIPITTVASEFAFSMGSRIITKWRSYLHPETADALLTTRSWLFGFDIGEGNDENQEAEGLEFQISPSQNHNHNVAAEA